MPPQYRQGHSLPPLSSYSGSARLRPPLLPPVPGVAPALGHCTEPHTEPVPGGQRRLEAIRATPRAGAFCTHIPFRCEILSPQPGSVSGGDCVRGEGGAHVAHSQRLSSAKETNERRQCTHNRACFSCHPYSLRRARPDTQCASQRSEMYKGRFLAPASYT